MKRGLILALMTALMLSVLPALAESPVIKTLPIVVMTNDTADQSGANSVFRYINALDLLDSNRVDWRNPTYDHVTGSGFRFYWTDAVDTSGIEIGVGKDFGWAEALTAAETDNLTNSALPTFGSPPASEKNIIQGGNTTLNLMNWNATTTTTDYGAHNTNHVPSKVRSLSIHSVDIAAFGLDYNASSGAAAGGLFTNDTGMNFMQSWTSAYPLHQADMNDQATELMLIAAVTSGTRVMPSQSALLEVYSLRDDAGGDRSDLAAEIAYHEPDPGSAWNRAPNPGVTTIVTPVIQPDPAGKCGFTVLTSDNPGDKIMFASWNVGDGSGTSTFPIPGGPSATLTDKLYQAELRLRSDAATADKSPGYRCEFTNQAYTNFGGVEVSTHWASQAPSLGNDYIVRLLWEVPYETADMSDTGTLSSWPVAGDTLGDDYRRYTLLFDLFHNQNGDNGVFTLEEIVVEVIDEPTGGTAASSYSSYSGWDVSFIGGDFADGTVTQGASSVTIVTGAFDAGYAARFAGTFPDIATAAGVFGDNAGALNNRILRLSTTAVSQDIDTTPICRLYLLPYRSNFTDYQVDLTRNVTYFVMFGALEPFAKYPISWGGRSVVSATQPNPGIPPAGAGTTLSLWADTGDGYDEANDYFVPILQVLSLNVYPPTGTGSGSGWEDDSGGMTCSNVTVAYY